MKQGEAEGAYDTKERERKRVREIDQSIRDRKREREAADIDGINNGALGSREVIVSQTHGWG